jgi:hypothetical protein
MCKFYSYTAGLSADIFVVQAYFVFYYKDDSELKNVTNRVAKIYGLVLLKWLFSK